METNNSFRLRLNSRTIYSGHEFEGGWTFIGISKFPDENSPGLIWCTNGEDSTEFEPSEFGAEIINERHSDLTEFEVWYQDEISG